jgi:hypothetical protein
MQIRLYVDEDAMARALVRGRRAPHVKEQTSILWGQQAKLTSTQMSIFEISPSLCRDPILRLWLIEQLSC